MNDTKRKSKTDNKKQDESALPHDTEAEYLKALADIKNGYRWTLVITLTLMAAAIACSVFYKVSIGLLVLVLAVVTYAAIVINLLYIKLGISYRAYHGCLTITALYGKERKTVYIPSRIINFTVSEIGTRAFTHESSKQIKRIYIPKSIIRIGTSAFARLHSLTDIYYEGSEEEWAELSRLAPLEDVTLHFNEPMPALPKKEKKSKKDKKDNKENKDQKAKSAQSDEDKS